MYAGVQVNERRNNPVFWVMIGIPAFAVLASVLLIVEAVRSKDYELPAEYAVEGNALEADFAAAEIARRAGVELRVDFASASQLRVRASAKDSTALPPTLELHFTHATLPALDRRIVLQRTAPDFYAAEFAPLERGRWLLQVDAKPANGPAWKLRKRMHAPFDVVTLGR